MLHDVKSQANIKPNNFEQISLNSPILIEEINFILQQFKNKSPERNNIPFIFLQN